MFENIEIYMQKGGDERRAHLDLGSPCIEIGGASKEFRGLLAHFLRTTMPFRPVGILCHACHNDKCSNVRHLYWGTYTENSIDYLTVSGKLRPPRSPLTKEEISQRIRDGMKRRRQRDPTFLDAQRERMALAASQRKYLRA